MSLPCIINIILCNNIQLTDDVKPKIEYSFNNNCAGKLEKDRCYKSRWSADITIQDYDSGIN